MTQAAAIDIHSPQTWNTLALLASRIGGLVLIAPVFSSRLIPGTVRTALVLLLTVVLFPAARTAGTVSTVTPGAVLGEVLAGLALGLGAALLVGAMEVAGDYMAMQTGLSGAALLDPLTSQQSAVMGTFLQVFAVTLLLTGGGHLVMLNALAASTREIPLGTALTSDRGMLTMATEGSTLFALGLQFAAPVMAVALIANVALAVLSRAAPQLNILQLAFPVQILAGLATLLAAIPLLGSWWMGWEFPYGELVSRAMNALGAR